jgi:prolipoprotein diacylglyceryltransferase
MSVLVILVALAGAFIRIGNLMNSEIYGKPTNSNFGYVYVRDFTDLLVRLENNRINKIKYSKIQDNKNNISEVKPLNLDIEFSGKVKSEEYVKNFANYKLRDAVVRISYQNNIVHPDIDELEYKIEKSRRKYHLIGRLYCVPRHPTQIYEAISYFLIFLLLMSLYQAKKLKLKEGYLFGVFMCTVFLARFIIEFIKENQEEFESFLPLNMGQILSIPFIILGIIFIISKRARKLEA